MYLWRARGRCLCLHSFKITSHSSSPNRNLSLSEKADGVIPTLHPPQLWPHDNLKSHNPSPPSGGYLDRIWMAVVGCLSCCCFCAKGRRRRSRKWHRRRSFMTNRSLPTQSLLVSEGAGLKCVVRYRIAGIFWRILVMEIRDA